MFGNVYKYADNNKNIDFYLYPDARKPDVHRNADGYTDKYAYFYADIYTDNNKNIDDNADTDYSYYTSNIHIYNKYMYGVI